MLILNKNILTIGGNRLEGGPLTPPTPPTPADEVIIGTQTWKNVNLAIDDGQGGVKIVEDLVYGPLYYYTQAAANRISDSIQGYHLPSESDWATLITYCGGTYAAGKKLKSTYGWLNNGNGTDDYGFCALPFGCYWGSTSKFMNTRAMFRTSTVGSSNNKFVEMSNTTDNAAITQGSNLYNSDYASVRLIKDT